MTAADIMYNMPILVPEDMALDALAKLLLDRRINGVPVVDDTANLKGVVTVTDLFRFIDESKEKALGSGRAWIEVLRERQKNSCVRDIMTQQVYTVTRSTAVPEVLELVMRHDIHTIPVLSDDKKDVVGIIGRHDIVLAFLRNQ
jgi:CBS-domain-containing membrane protein